MSVSGFSAWVRGSLWAVLASVTLQGCGGGGGGGGGGNGAPDWPDRNLPLTLDGSNFTRVSSAGLHTVETTLKLGQQAATEVATMARYGKLEMDQPCAGSGTAHYTLLDADGNQVLSAGDSLKIDYALCPLDYMGGRYTGTLIIRLKSVTDAMLGSVSGTLDFGAGLVGDVDLGNWLGTLDFDRQQTGVQDRLSISATSADDLRRVFRVWIHSVWVDQVETYQQLQLVRTLQRDTARASVAGSLLLASERLGGRVEIRLDQPLGGILDTHADSGSLLIKGAANTRITLPATLTGGTKVQAELDSNGDGVTDSTQVMDWNNLFDGFLWSQMNYPSIGYLYARDDRYLLLLSAPDFHEGQGVSTSEPLRLQFDQPLSSRTRLYAQLADLGSLRWDAEYHIDGDALSDDRPLIDADVVLNGAVAYIRPREPLRYGHDYQLYVGNAWDDDPRMVGNASETVRTEIGVHFFNTDDMLWAAVHGAGRRSVVMPDQATALSAEAPMAISPPLDYRWAQLSGPSLVLDTPGSANTNVRLADGVGPGVGRAMLQLTVTDAVGRASVTPVEMQVANPVGVDQLLYFRSETGDFVGGGQTRIFSGQTDNFYSDTTRGYLTVSYDKADNTERWSLQLKAAGGGVPGVGTYTNVVGTDEWNSGAVAMDFSNNGSGCTGLTGSFEVLEIEVSGGKVQRLAADFDQTCLFTNPTAPLHGSIRFNSSLPIRR